MSNENSEDKALTPSGMSGIAEGIEDLLAESAASPEKKKEAAAEGGEEPCETCDEEKETNEKAPKVRFYIKDAETGQEIPAVFKSGGKEHIPDSIDKLMTWTGMGIHANRTLEEVKGIKEFVNLLKKAHKEGRLIIKDDSDSSPSVKEKVEEEDTEDEILTDPVVLKERKKRQELEGQVKSLQKTVDVLKAFLFKNQTAEIKKEIEMDIERFSKKYPLGKKRASEVWKLLGQVDEDDRPVYSVESAMKEVHEKTLSELKEFIKEHPELIEKDKISQEAIAAYLKEKEEKEKHPVSAPSGVPAGKEKVEEDKGKGGLAGIAPAIRELLASSVQAGKKS